MHGMLYMFVYVCVYVIYEYTCVLMLFVCVYIFIPGVGRFTGPPLGLYTKLPSSNMVWCMAYKRGVGGRACIAQWSCNGIAIA